MQYKYYVVCFISALVFNVDVRAQNSSQKDESTSNVFANINAGFGLLYGGFGLSGEFGKKHFSAFGGYGYSIEQKVDNNTIDATFNYHTGLRYYLDVNSSVVFPRVGIGYGWITNYYASGLSKDEFKQNVQGLSLHLGTQFLAQNGLIFSIDLAASSKWLVPNIDQHPKFFNVYIRPCVGVGYDLDILFRKKEQKKIRNKEINPFG